MEAEQRRTVALAQRQKRIQSQGLAAQLSRQLARQVTPGQVMVASTVGKLSALLAAPGVTCRASWRLSCAARRIASSEWPPRAKKSASISFTLVAAAFSQLLGCEVNDIDADFFALGGHSLLAMRARRIASSEWPPRAKKSASISFTSQPSS
jgi:hypothetical protein